MGDEQDSHFARKRGFPMHPCHTPRGMNWYNLNVLTGHQQKDLNEVKADQMRENNRYLAKHPEIRGLIVLFLKEVLRKQQTSVSVRQIAAAFFSRPREVLEKELAEYLRKKGEPKNKEGTSALDLRTKTRTTTETRTSEELMGLFHGDFTYISYSDILANIDVTEPEQSSVEEAVSVKPKTSESLIDVLVTTITDSETDKQFSLTAASSAQSVQTEEPEEPELELDESEESEESREDKEMDENDEEDDMKSLNLTEIVGEMEIGEMELIAEEELDLKERHELEDDDPIIAEIETEVATIELQPEQKPADADVTSEIVDE